MDKNGIIAVVVVMAAVLLIGLWVMGSSGPRRNGAQLDCEAPPETPTAVTYTKAGDTVNITWTASPGDERPSTYVIEAGTATGLNNAGTFIGPGTVTNFQRQAPAGTYYVRIFARNACGTSAASNEIAVTIP
jgi:hypothetical protein